MPLWVVDIGHRFTHVCAVARTKVALARSSCPSLRTIARGGRQLTQAVARAHDLHFTRAEMLKHEYGLDESSDPKTAGALRTALKPR